MSYRNQIVSQTKKHLDGLLHRFNSLKTFADVQEWDAEAKTHTDTILVCIPDIESDVARFRRELENHRSSLSRFRKLVPWDKTATQLQRSIQEADELISNCYEIVSDVQSRIDKTPNDKEEQKLLIKELRLRKKELQLEKKQVNSQLRNIREDASVQYASAASGFTRLMGLTAAQRRDIRLNKEAALSPHKSERNFIERKISALDRQILWAESIK